MDPMSYDSPLFGLVYNIMTPTLAASPNFVNMRTERCRYKVHKNLKGLSRWLYISYNNPTKQ